MTRQDFILKWLFYALALLPVWWMDTFVLGRFPVLGVAPMLLPVAAVAVAVLEGALAGAGFGLAVGVLCDAVYFGGHGFLTLGLCLIGWGAGAAAQYVLSRSGPHRHGAGLYRTLHGPCPPARPAAGGSAGGPLVTLFRVPPLSLVYLGAEAHHPLSAAVEPAAAQAAAAARRYL